MNMIPTLTASGFVPVEQGLDYLFADALAADNNQTDDFGELVTSIPAILEKAHKTQTYAQELEKGLTSYFNRHFTTVNVTCTQTDTPDGLLSLNLMAVVEYNGKKQDLQRTIFGSHESQSFKLIQILNG